MKPNLRKGTAQDIPALLKLIQELADYEKAPNEVEVTEEILLNDGFGENKVFDFFVLEDDNEVIGIALYYIKYSTWKGKCVFLEDLVVSLKHRRKGYGGLLFDAVALEAAKLKVKRMEWQVLDWNDSAIDFYKKKQAHLDPEWINGKLVYDQLQQLK